MTTAIVYSKPDCPWCDRAKSVLRRMGQDFVERNIMDELDARRDYKALFTDPEEKRTVPQVVIAGRRVGGYESLCKHYGISP